MEHPMQSATDNSKKVLIIEDETAMAKAMQIKFQKSGIESVIVSDGQKGLEQIRTNEYQLALLDLMMPTVDGWEVLETVKKESLPIKIIVTSNLNQDEDIAKAKELGAISFLIKSNETLENILEAVQEQLQ
jgi:CheY-like chemotaxis protein